MTKVGVKNERVHVRESVERWARKGCVALTIEGVKEAEMQKKTYIFPKMTDADVNVINLIKAHIHPL